MNRNVIIGLIVLVLAAGGYYLFGKKGDVDDATKAVATATDDAAATAKKAADDAAAKVEADAKKAADDAAAATKQAETDAAAAAKKAEEDAAAAAKKAADDAAAAAKKVADEAAAAAKAATDATAAAGTDAMATTKDAMAGVADLLTPEKFDLAKVSAAIDASTLDDAKKTMLKTALTNAQKAPALLPDVLTQVKTALGL